MTSIVTSATALPSDHAVVPTERSAAAAIGTVADGRERIDAFDEQIATLIRCRIEASRGIQAARLADGGRRVDLRRESEIIGRYRAALGRPGVAIAMALLELGRGPA